MRTKKGEPEGHERDRLEQHDNLEIERRHERDERDDDNGEPTSQPSRAMIGHFGPQPPLNDVVCERRRHEQENGRERGDDGTENHGREKPADNVRISVGKMRSGFRMGSERIANAPIPV